MGKPTGFLENDRLDRHPTSIKERIQHFNEFMIPLDEQEIKTQASRCMDCGIPYCHITCPVNNQIPDWNDLVYTEDWKNALYNLHSTNNFPEFTGRICPAPCETGCTLNLIDQPVTIKSIECAIIDKGWQEGWITPHIASQKTGKRVAIIGSGPAGLSAAQQLAREGHDVHIYEKHTKAGGLLRYGIPDFKMEKHLIDQRIEQMEKEGVIFHYNICVGVDISVTELFQKYHALIFSGGSEKPRDLPVEGRHLQNVHFALDFLCQQNRKNGQESLGHVTPITAHNKHVVVIGGGDTGSDCIGTSFRQGALSVTQLEIMPIPPEKENKDLIWPNWPLKFRTSTSQEEGAIRDFSVITDKILGENNQVTALQCFRVDDKFNKQDKTQFEIKADLVLLAMGFIHPIYEGLLEQSGVTLDNRGNILANTEDYKTSQPNIFSCGDMRRGQSLVVWAIREGRQCAESVNQFLCQI